MIRLTTVTMDGQNGCMFRKQIAVTTSCLHHLFYSSVRHKVCSLRYNQLIYFSIKSKISNSICWPTFYQRKISNVQGPVSHLLASVATRHSVEPTVKSWILIGCGAMLPWQLPMNGKVPRWQALWNHARVLVGQPVQDWRLKENWCPCDIVPVNCFLN